MRQTMKRPLQADEKTYVSITRIRKLFQGFSMGNCWKVIFFQNNFYGVHSLSHVGQASTMVLAAIRLLK